MKTISASAGFLIQLCLATGALSAHAQGVVAFKNFGSGRNGTISPIAFIFESDEVTRLDGAQYSVQLYAGPQGSAESALVPVGSSSEFLSGSAAGLFNYLGDAGNFVVIPIVGVGEVAVLQVRAWDNFDGAADSWEKSTRRGSSNLLEIELAALEGPPPPAPDFPPGRVPTLVGLQSFSIQPIPEPSAPWLAVLGLGGLLVSRKGKIFGHGKSENPSSFRREP